MDTLLNMTNDSSAHIASQSYISLTLDRAPLEDIERRAGGYSQMTFILIILNPSLGRTFFVPGRS